MTLKTPPNTEGQEAFRLRLQDFTVQLAQKARNQRRLDHRLEVEQLFGLFDQYLAKESSESESRAARKIQAVINAHRGLNSDTEVLELVESSLAVVNQLEVEAHLSQNPSSTTKQEGEGNE